MDTLNRLDYAHLPIVDFSHFERAFNYVRSDVNKSALAKLRSFFGQGNSSLSPSPVANFVLQDVPEDVSTSFSRIFKAYTPSASQLAKWNADESFIHGWEELALESQTGLLSPKDVKNLRKSTPLYLKCKARRLFAIRSGTPTAFAAADAPTVDAFMAETLNRSISSTSFSTTSSSTSFS